MSNRLLVNPGTPQAWAIELKPGVNRIGRGTDNNFTINHGSVSTQHCEFTVTDDGVLLKDLGSTNGTFVERVPVTQLKLQHGQQVQLGAVNMVLESIAATVPAPITPTALSTVPSSPPPMSGLRINKAHPAEAASGVAAPEAIIPTAPPIPGQFKPIHSDAAKKPEGNFALSVTGVVLGAIIGMVVWHLIYRFTGWRIGIMALATGCLAGVAPQILGHYRSKMMGVIAAITALVAIFTAQYLNARVQFDQFVDDTSDEIYNARMDYAKSAIQATPNGTDEEIRNFLAADLSSEEYKVKPEEIEAEAIADFKNELPELRDMAAGKISKEQYNKDLDEGREVLEESGFLRIYFLIRALGIFNIVNIVLGVGAAYLTAKGDR
jgi:hypothetical protein